MIFSVYDYPSGKYHYYEAPMLPPATGWFRAPIGSVPTPESIAEPLPENAVRVGEGSVAKGIIAAKDIGSFSLDFRIPNWAKFAAIAGVAYWLGKKR